MNQLACIVSSAKLSMGLSQFNWLQFCSRKSAFVRPNLLFGLAASAAIVACF